MARKFLLGAAALIVSCSLACAGESKVKVEAGIDIGVAGDAVAEIDGEDITEYGGVSMVPRAAVTVNFTEQWSAKLHVRGVVGFDDDSGEVVSADAETSYRDFVIGGLAGYTFKLGDRLALTPVAGMSYRGYVMEADVDDLPVEVDLDASVGTIDFGAEVDVKLTDKVSFSGGLMFGIPFAGSNDISVDGLGSADADLDGGFLVSVVGEVAYNVTGNIALVGGLGYEKTMLDWDWDDGSETVGGEDDIGRFTLRLGASFSF